MVIEDGRIVIEADRGRPRAGWAKASRQISRLGAAPRPTLIRTLAVLREIYED